MKSENDIPKFDLEEQILAEHRKSASVKRKAPVKDRDNDRKRKSGEKSHESNIVQQILDNAPFPANDKKTTNQQLDTDNEQNDADKIIKEIVARDIQNFRSNHHHRI